MGDELGGIVPGTVNALGEIVKISKESPDARAAGVYAAKSLKIVAQTVHSVLLPLAAANYGVQRFEAYMRERFGDELGEKLREVPPEDIVQPRPVIAGPVLDALVYAHDETDLRDLYLSLLAKAMDGRDPAAAHPAFTDVLKQLDSIEVPYLREVLTGGSDSWPIVRLDSQVEGSTGSQIAVDHFLDWRLGDDAAFSPATSAYVDNWLRLGLIETDYDKWLAAEGAYDWVELRSDYQEYVRAYGAVTPVPMTILITKGRLRVTNWGKQFAKAISLAEVPDGAPVQSLGVWHPSLAKTPSTNTA